MLLQNNSIMKQTAQEYIAQQLKNGLTLSKLVQPTIMWECGRYASIHYDQIVSIEHETQVDFDLGSPLKTPVHRRTLPDGRTVRIQYNEATSISEKFLSQTLCTVFAKDPTPMHPTALIENVLLTRKDNVEAADIYFYNDEIYHVVDFSASLMSLAASIKSAESLWRTVGFIADINSQQMASRKEVSHQFLQEASCNVKLIFARAFDLEGFVLWYHESLLDRFILAMDDRK